MFIIHVSAFSFITKARRLWCDKTYYSITTSGVSSITLSPSFTSMAVTLPDFSASRLLAIFMASRTTTVSPAFTSSPTFTFISVMTPGRGDFTALFRFTLFVEVGAEAVSASG